MAEANNIREDAGIEDRPTEVNQTENKTAEELRSMNDRLYTEVKALRTESKDRRLKLDEFEKAEQERADMELSKVEKLTKERDAAIAALTKERETTARNVLNSQFTSKVTDAGLPLKIAKVAIPSNLSEDNMKDKVKETIKEFADFVKGEKPVVKPNPSVSIQPGVTPNKDLTELSPAELIALSLDRTDANKI